MQNLYELEVVSIDGQKTTLAQHRGKVLLVVNVASRCGFTSQYTGLEALYRKHAAEGLVVLGFPCNQFGKQEPGTEEQIQTFCSTTYDVTFPLFAKIDVNGENAHPLYQLLRGKDGAPIQWNFEKFSVDRQGNVKKRYSSSDTPEAIERDVVELLSAS
jgi:glutathione peroxidase